MPGRRWSKTMNCWHVPNSKKAISQLKDIGINYTEPQKLVKAVSVNDLVKPPTPVEPYNQSKPQGLEVELLQEHKVVLSEFKKYLEWKRLSDKTQVIYIKSVKRFMNYFTDKSVKEVTHNDVNGYIHSLVVGGYSRSMQNIVVSAIKLFYSKVLNKNMDIQKIERPTREYNLPKVIAKQDIEKMLSGMSNIKHQTAILLIYAFGLRRSELLNLKLEDIDSQSMVLNIRNAKGRKDRTLPLSENILVRIRKYYMKCKPQVYLIEGAKKGEPYSATSLQNIFHKHMDRVKPNNRFTLHCLRHSCATHLLDDGTDIRYIQELLGHKSTRTTEIYTHVSIRSLRNIKMPGDEFNI